MTLPRCDRSDLPRILCACCDSFTMTDAERAYLTHRNPDHTPTPPPPTTPRPWRPIPEYTDQPYAPPAARKAGGGGQGNPCRVCQTPAGDAYLCPGCTDQTERDLGDVPALVEDLTIHATGGSRFTGAGSGTGLPYAEAAARLLHTIRNHLATSIRSLTENRGLPAPTLGDDTVAMSRWLLRHAAAIPLDPAGPDITAGLRRWHEDSMRAIDAPRERRYIGVCRADMNGQPCGTPLHAPAGEGTYRCPRCNTGYDVAAQLEQIAARVRDVTATVDELVTLAYRDGHKITQKVIEGLVRRGRLQQVGKSRPARYRAGDLLGLLDERRAG